MHWVLYLLAFLPVFGQLLRFELNSGGAFLATDLVVWSILAYYLFYKVGYSRKWKLGAVGKPLLYLWGVMLVSLAFGCVYLNVRQIAVSSLYFLRFVAYSGLYFVVKDFLDTPVKRMRILNVFAWSALFTGLLGFLQLKYYSNFHKLQWDQAGWDPHIGRLTSTWLDPNFVGGYFGFIIIVLLCLLVYFLHKKQWKGLTFATVIIATLLAAIMLTYSRSSYLAFFCGLIVLGIIRFRILVLITVFASVLLFSTSTRLQTRVSDAVSSFKSMFSGSTHVLDPTARLRLQSWEQGFSIIKANPLLGIGYNTLRFENVRQGNAPEKSHAASGFDSSLLTIFATTGIIGFLFFMYMFVQIMLLLWKKANAGDEFRHFFALGLFCVFASLFVHSFFVNAFFFPFIMIPLWMSVSLAEEL